MRGYLDIHKKHGVWTVYIRKSTSDCTACDGTELCSRCFGTGNPVSLERMKVVLAKGRTSLANELDTLPGMIIDPTQRAMFRAYFLPEDRPKQGDLVLELSWDRTKPKGIEMPVSIVHVYSIEQAEPMYKDGKLAYRTNHISRLLFEEDN